MAALSKAKIIVKHTREEFIVQFNPEEYTLNKDNNFASQAIPGLSSPVLQFVNGNMATLDMELLFDTYDTPSFEKQDVRDTTNKFMRLLDIDNELHAPPVLEFSWASLLFDCVLAKATQKFILFANDGKPLRARINATFNEYRNPEKEVVRLNLHSSDISKSHVVKDGESLSIIATHYYKDAGKWRPIAIANQLDNPTSLTAGLTLYIPSLPFSDPVSGEVVN